MLYVVTEDKNSARVFWTAIVKCFCAEESYEIVELPKAENGQSYGGNTTLNQQISEVFQKIQPQDELFVAFDVIMPTRQFNPVDFLDKIIRRCELKKVKLYVTSYYCFEELYISYSELINMYEQFSTDEDMKAALKYIRDCILQNKDYYDKNDSRIQHAIGLAPANAGKNREHFMDTLLFQTTRCLKGYFQISKREDGFGKCWHKDCDEIRSNENDKYINYFCTVCQYCCKDTERKEKLIDLAKKIEISRKFINKCC